MNGWLDLRADELQRRVILVVVEIPDVQRSACRQVGAFEVDGVVVSAQSKLPGFAGGWRPARANHVGPGDAAFNGPSRVAVLPAIQRSVELDLCFDVKLAVGNEPLKATGSSLGEEHVHLSPGSADLEFVVTGPLICRLEEQFEDVVGPRSAIVLGDVRIQIGVLHFGEEVEVIPIPQQPRLCG